MREVFFFLYHKIPLFILMLLVCALCWFVQLYQSDDAIKESPSSRAHIVDYFMENFNGSVLNKEGGAHYRVKGSLLKHYEDDASYDVTQPALRAFYPNQPELTVIAKRGTMSGDSEVIELFGDAQLWRAPAIRTSAKRSSSFAEVRVRSEFFRVFLKQDIVETDQPVTVLNGTSVAYADGMVYNNITRTVALNGRVHGHLFAPFSKTSVPDR
ncbi:MAG: LPS export ABC transporter periplasmic protein LptC [Ottowia sp.]|nr:LPS export ABC transporter periplasmic protein LptC [Ottowia sp.]